MLNFMAINTCIVTMAVPREFNFCKIFCLTLCWPSAFASVFCSFVIHYSSSCWQRKLLSLIVALSRDLLIVFFFLLLFFFFFFFVCNSFFKKRLQINLELHEPSNPINIFRRHKHQSKTVLYKIVIKINYVLAFVTEFRTYSILQGIVCRMTDNSPS